MKISQMRTTSMAFAITLFAALSSSCAVTGGGYGYDGGGVSVGLDYYEPYGGYYGGWGSSYRVGPNRGDHRNDHHDDHGDHGHPTHSYRPAPSTHSAPSIPSHPHSSGGHRN